VKKRASKGKDGEGDHGKLHEELCKKNRTVKRGI
jgi:hypothetical protein